jgi:hypothetical protein
MLQSRATGGEAKVPLPLFETYESRACSGLVDALGVLGNPVWRVTGG